MTMVRDQKDNPAQTFLRLLLIIYMLFFLATIPSIVSERMIPEAEYTTFETIGEGHEDFELFTHSRSPEIPKIIRESHGLNLYFDWRKDDYLSDIPIPPPKRF